MSWMVPLTKLSEEQLQFIEQEIPKNKNHWIKGFAGSGKSILLVHGIYNLIKHNPKVKICMVVFTHSLKQLFSAGFKELNIQEKNIYICTYHQFRKENNSYDYIFCDEVQDLPKSILEKMKLNAKYVISGGDSNQSIYYDDPQTKELTVSPSEIGNILNATAWELNTIYRLTKSLVKAVSYLMPSMGILKTMTDNTKVDVTPNLASASSKDKEVNYIMQKAKDSIGNAQNAVIILPGHKDIIEFLNKSLSLNGKSKWDEDDENNKNRYGKTDYQKLNEHLRKSGVDIEYIGNGYGNLYSTGQTGKIIIMTYHSSKGLDFDNVYLPFMNSEKYSAFTETLFMVGMTRSKLNLHISYSGTMHNYVKKIESSCNKIDIDKIMNQASNSFDDDFDF